jgi:hypothetical protein
VSDQATSVVQDPPRHVYRLSWRPIAIPLGLSLVLAALLVYLIASGRSVMAAVWLPLSLVLIVWMALLNKRARTEIGHDGIRDRKLRREVFLPWAELIDVQITTHGSHRYRFVRVLRGDGRWVTLAAMRDPQTSPDPALDRAVEAMREQIDLHGSPDRVPSNGTHDEWSESDRVLEPFVLRPSRRPLLWLIPLIAGLVTLGMVSSATWNAGTGVACVCAAVYGIHVVAVLLRGRTAADRDGLRYRVVTTTTFVPWDQVEGLVVVPTLAGRIVRLVVVGGGRRVLAAPRELPLGRDPGFDDAVEAMQALALPDQRGLRLIDQEPSWLNRTMSVVLLVFVISGAVIVDRPWLAYWWPGRHEATQIPRACAVADPAIVRRILPRAEPNGDMRENSRYDLRSECGWLDADDVVSNVVLRLVLHRRVFTTSATGQASDAFDSTANAYDDADRRAVPGIGDEATWTVETYGSGSHMILAARRANVTVEVEYWGPRQADEVAADTEALARAAVNQVRLD